jgi:peptidoglycan/LPS O-acetylase OafA/YrhL
VWTPGHRLAWIYGEPVYWPRLATNFLAGSLFYLYRDRIKYSRWLVTASAAVLVVFSALPALKSLELLAPILGGYSLFYVGFLPIRRLRGFADQCDLSYGTYLYGFPIQQLVFECFGPNLKPYAVSVIAVPIALGLAFLSWTLVEAPFLRSKSRAGASIPSSAQDGNGLSRSLLWITTRSEEVAGGSPAGAITSPCTES